MNVLAPPVVQHEPERLESKRFERHLASRGLQPLVRGPVRTLQLNIETRCNLACHHCHVESGPNRKDRMSRRDCDRVIELLRINPGVETLDLTGGAPELHPEFRHVVSSARALGRHVIDRCNLTVLFETGQEDTAQFLADQQVEIVASLPCYTAGNVEQQRGRGVFDKSVAALQLLNELGYSRGGARRLRLVYNPVGPFLPPDQSELESTYRAELREHFGIEFDELITITNMPIKRFAHQLVRDGQMEGYMSLLVAHFNPATLPSLMCRDLVSVDFAGRLFDCDFNQALALAPPDGQKTIWDVEELGVLEGCGITTASHCFGCSAGAGSSCSGTLT